MEWRCVRPAVRTTSALANPGNTAPRFDPIAELRIVDIAPHNKQVDRRADSEIGPHRGIHRDQADLESVIRVRIEGDGAIENRLAVFMLADLEVRRVGGAFDEVAGRIDHVKPQLAALDLAAKQKRHVIVNVGGLERWRIRSTRTLRTALPMRCAA